MARPHREKTSIDGNPLPYPVGENSRNGWNKG